MVARTAELIGVEHIGFGSDLCQGQPDSVVEWMRNGRWTKERDFGEGSANDAGFPSQPSWFKNSTNYPGIAEGLIATGFSEDEVTRICWQNWYDFMANSFEPA